MHNDSDSSRKFPDFLSSTPFMQSQRQLIVEKLCRGEQLKNIMSQDRLKNEEFDFDLSDQLRPIG